MLHRISLVAFCALLAGCISSPPARTDPFADLNSGGPVYKNLSLGLILSDNTLKSIDYMKATEIYVKKFPKPPPFESDKPYKDVTEVLKRTFKSAVKVSSPEEAKAQGVDLIGVLDMYIKLGKAAFQTTRFDEKLILMTFDQTVIDTVEGVGEGTIPFSGASMRVYEASEMASSGIAKGLIDSAKLQEFSRGRMGVARETAAAPAAEPRPASIHSDVDAPSFSLPENPDNFAIVVGIEKYPSLPPAQFARRDAKAVEKHLLALGYPQRNIILLTDAQASRASLAKNLETWLPRNVNENSTVFFYYSGHGAPDAVTGRAYLVPSDGDPQYLDDTGYAVSRLYEKLSALKAKRVLVAIDSCFSGAGGRSVLPAGARPLVTKIDAGSLAGDKVVAFSASGAEEISGVIEEQGHGLFTYFLLRGLDGAAKDDRGHVSAKALYDYLLPRVRDAARRDNRDQTPQLAPASVSGAEIQIR